MNINAIKKDLNSEARFHKRELKKILVAMKALGINTIVKRKKRKGKVTKEAK